VGKKSIESRVKNKKKRVFWSKLYQAPERDFSGFIKKKIHERDLFIHLFDRHQNHRYNNGANNAISAAKTKRAQREHRSHVARGVFAPAKVGIYRRVFAKRLSRVEDTFIARQSDSKVR